MLSVPLLVALSCAALIAFALAMRNMVAEQCPGCLKLSDLEASLNQDVPGRNSRTYRRLQARRRALTKRCAVCSQRLRQTA